ncbi:aldo/keto reductase [Exercitatus varius]|uniref:aldo/keto reductase n=1 Tax=Exercitatus varius TaxID=67857 RepID=UPI00294ACE21|nr:aldo/keto reductase [Exercitatus varius]MDG2941615.1 aldo/keto reductase [Exercitatus varius]
MTQRILGKDLKVSAIGLGIMGMDHAYGAQADRAQMVNLIQSAVDLGNTLFDTAPVYGESNEQLLGQALKPIREKAVIATKFGIVGMEFKDGKFEQQLDSSPKAIREQVEKSLRNLQTDYIDLYFQHRIDPKIAPELVAETMGELMKEGKIRHWGVSNAPLDYMRKAHQITPITATENQYSMLFREPEQELFDLCEELSIGFMAYSPLGNGFLSGKAGGNFAENDVRRSMKRFSAEAVKKNQPLLDFIHQLAQAKNATAAQIVLAWELAQRSFIVPIPGTTKRSRLQENLGAMNVRLSVTEVAEINHILNQLEIDESYF